VPVDDASAQALFEQAGVIQVESLPTNDDAGPDKAFGEGDRGIDWPPPARLRTGQVGSRANADLQLVQSFLPMVPLANRGRGESVHGPAPVVVCS